MTLCTFTAPNYNCNRKAEKVDIPKRPSMTKTVSLLLNHMHLRKLQALKPAGSERTVFRAIKSLSLSTS